ncbi:flagellar hook-length control protein FliK [Loktanella ponticola]|uniref:Flagellar hook-length control protein FliK n=1 Tax=Yoonia ponticola TaxID=1524255 RepID=A0A7W9BKP2_9RHOB|nr:flagellar hook-length control protein FliK [Yoonia ponticola]MBB5722299.1 flagellar hook-length control protein FliK [Yoonia ponticola]
MVEIPILATTGKPARQDVNLAGSTGLAEGEGVANLFERLVSTSSADRVMWLDETSAPEDEMLITLDSEPASAPELEEIETVAVQQLDLVKIEQNLPAPRLAPVSTTDVEITNKSSPSSVTPSVIGVEPHSPTEALRFVVPPQSNNRIDVDRRPSESSLISNESRLAVAQKTPTALPQPQPQPEPQPQAVTFPVNRPTIQTTETIALASSNLPGKTADLIARIATPPQSTSNTQPLFVMPAQTSSTQHVDTVSALQLKTSSPKIPIQDDETPRPVKFARVDLPRETVTPAHITTTPVTQSSGVVSTQIAGGLQPPLTPPQSGSRREGKELLEFAVAGEPSTRQSVSTTSPVQITPSHVQSEARQIAQQLAVQFSKQSDGTTVIRLNPEGLGHVRMTLGTTDGVMTMIVVAERPETADIMRRNMNELAQEFQSLGYDSLNFEFGGSATPEQDAANVSGTRAEGEFEDPEQPDHRQNAPQDTAIGRLNLRL